MPKEKPADYVEKAVMKAAKATAKKTAKPKAETGSKAQAEVNAKPRVEESPKDMVDVYLAKLNATIYSDEYIPMAIRVAELSQKPMAKDYPPLSLSNTQLRRITVEPHVLSITGKKERLVKTPDGEKHGVLDNVVVWMVFKIPSEFKLNRDEVEDIIGLLQFRLWKIWHVQDRRVQLHRKKLRRRTLN